MPSSSSTVVKKFSTLKQAQFRRHVGIFCDQFDPGHPGHGLPECFAWRFALEFPLSQIAGAVDEWTEWSAAETAAWIADYDPSPSEDLRVRWLQQPWKEPVIVVEGTDGAFYVWDGNHRIGVAFSAGRVAVPAIAGFRRPRSGPCGAPGPPS